MKYKNIIWDWNGTLLDDVKMNLEIENILLERRGKKQIESIEEYREKFCFPIIKFYEELGFELEKERFEDVAREYVFLYDEMYPRCELFEDAEGVLRFFREKGVNQLIISQTEQSFLTNQVRYFEIEQYFVQVLGNSDIYARGKVALAQRWMEENSALPSETLMVGDTVHDKEVADAVGCDCILIPKGHNSEQQLRQSGALLVESILSLREAVI